MNRYDLISQLNCELSKPCCDAKAELVLALALEKGISYDDLMVCFDSWFHRGHSNDVYSAELTEDKQGKKVLQLHLSRTGIFEQLPEAFFFQPRPDRRRFSAAEMAAEYRLNQQKEQGIRRFFQPLDLELLKQRVQLEIVESDMLQGLNSPELIDYFIKFWGLPRTIPQRFVVPFINLLPHASKIAGNLSLTAKCLEVLLQETVRLEKVTAPVTDTSLHFKQALGNQQFGVDMVLGQEFAADFPMLEFSIGPLQSWQVPDYLEGGDCFLLIDTFYRYFLPAGIDAEIRLIVSVEDRHMMLEDGDEPILGYSSVLQS